MLLLPGLGGGGLLPVPGGFVSEFVGLLELVGGRDSVVVLGGFRVSVSFLELERFVPPPSPPLGAVPTLVLVEISTTLSVYVVQLPAGISVPFVVLAGGGAAPWSGGGVLVPPFGGAGDPDPVGTPEDVVFDAEVDESEVRVVLASPANSVPVSVLVGLLVRRGVEVNGFVPLAGDVPGSPVFGGSLLGKVSVSFLDPAGCVGLGCE